MATVYIKTDPEDDWGQGRNGLIKMARVNFWTSAYWTADNGKRFPPKLYIDVLNKRGQVCNAGLAFAITPEVVAGLKKVVEAAEAALKES